MKKLFFLSVFCVCTVLSFGQEELIRCGNSIHQEALKAEFPDVEKQVNAIYNDALKGIAQPEFKSSGVVYTIPVVVHVVHKNGAENISAAQVQSQLDILNLDYRKMNPDAPMVPGNFANLAADAEIEFCLATVDPNGNPTDGITRTPTNVSSFSVSSDNIKVGNAGGKNPWNTSRYLNIWTGEITGGVLGYATPPGTPASRDGVVIDYKYFGTLGTATYPYNRGRTCTHEVAHYFALKHIWGDDQNSPQGVCSSDDDISDTPLQGVAYGGCPSNGVASCGSTDMFMNFLDYTDDRCMFMFTHEQVAVMRYVIENYRSVLVQNTPVACDPTGGAGCTDLAATMINMGFEDSDNYYPTVVNSNNDDKFWQISEGVAPEWGPRSGSKCMAYTWNVSQNADDWFFTPCFEVKANRDYELRFWYATAKDASAVYPEKMEVALSTTPSVDNIGPPLDLGTLTQPYDPNLPDKNYKQEVLTFSPETDVEFYIGFHCYSDADQYAMLVDDIEIVDLTAVSNENVVTSETFKAYPNPVADLLTLEFDFEKTIENMQVNLVDMTGRTIHTAAFEHYSTGNVQFDMSSYSNGLYFIHIQADEAISTHKIMVAK